jgi:hypothetical protein
VDRSERMRRLAEPVESLAQSVARRVIELVVEALDLNALLDQIDLNRVLDQVDVNRLLDKVDVDKLVARVDVRALLTQVDVNELASQVDINAMLQRTDVEALLTRSSSSIVSEGIDLVRSQAVGLDDFLARWVSRLRRRRYAGPPAPLRLARPPQAES